jgi:hypothetical protein
MYYDEPDKKDLEQYVYNQSPKSREQIIEGESIDIYLSPDKEKSTQNINDVQEEEEWF